jgi:hypothetical protein
MTIPYTLPEPPIGYWASGEPIFRNENEGLGPFRSKKKLESLAQYESEKQDRAIGFA